MLIVGYHLAFVDRPDTPRRVDGYGTSDLWLRLLVQGNFLCIVRVDRGCSFPILQMPLIESLHRQVLSYHDHIIVVYPDDWTLSV